MKLSKKGLLFVKKFKISVLSIEINKPYFFILFFLLSIMFNFYELPKNSKNVETVCFINNPMYFLLLRQHIYAVLSNRRVLFYKRLRQSKEIKK